MKNGDVIDLLERSAKKQELSLSKNLKLRLDIEQAKIMISSSLISVVFLVTLANNALMAPPDVSTTSMSSTSDVMVSTGGASRGIASVPTGTSVWEDKMAQDLSGKKLVVASVGRKPSSLENLTLGFLEGKYAIRLLDGKLSSLEFSDAAGGGDRPKYVTDRAKFLSENRQLLAIQFETSVKVESHRVGEMVNESYDLIDESQKPVGRVEFQMDASGRLLSMKVLNRKLASN